MISRASRSLRIYNKHDFFIVNFAVKIKFVKRNIKCSSGILNLFVISAFHYKHDRYKRVLLYIIVVEMSDSLATQLSNEVMI